MKLKQSKKEKEFDFKKYEEEMVSGLMSGKGFLGEEGLLKLKSR